MEFSVFLLLMIAGVSVIMDLCRMKVANGWILFSLFSGFLMCFFQEGIRGIGEFAAGAVFPVLILGVLFYFRMIGAGDIKLFCALGGIMGITDVFRCMLVSLFLGAGISLLILIFYGGICCRIRYFIRYFYDLMMTGNLKPYVKKGQSLENFHFTIPIFMSVMLYAGGVY